MALSWVVHSDLRSLWPLTVHVQDQHAFLTRPVVAGVLADAVDESQPAFFQGGFQLLLPHLVLFSAQLLTERIPGGDVCRTKALRSAISFLESGQGLPMFIVKAVHG